MFVCFSREEEIETRQNIDTSWKRLRAELLRIEGAIREMCILQDMTVEDSDVK